MAAAVPAAAVLAAAVLTEPEVKPDACQPSLDLDHSSTSRKADSARRQRVTRRTESDIFSTC